MRRYALGLALFLPLAAVAVAGCGNGTTSSAASAAGQTTSGHRATTLRLEAASTGALEFDRTSLEAPAGKVTIVMTNPSSVPHNIAIEGNSVNVAGKIVANGGTSTVTADLDPGTYTFLCTVDSHARAGMEGMLTVR